MGSGRLYHCLGKGLWRRVWTGGNGDIYRWLIRKVNYTETNYSMKNNYRIRENGEDGEYGIVEIFDDFDLQKIADSGQCFRWKELNSGGYQIIHQEYILVIEQIADGLYRFHCRKDEFLTIWKDYFDLEENYSRIRRRINKDEDVFLYTASQKEAGIRILQQDLWEVLISFLISQNRSIPLIKNPLKPWLRRPERKKSDLTGRCITVFSLPRPFVTWIKTLWISAN